MTKIKVELDIPDFPESEDDWQIYSDMHGARHVAKNLTQALKECFNISDRDEAWAHVYRAMLDHQKYGSTDTEPRNVALDILEKYHPAWKNAKKNSY